MVVKPHTDISKKTTEDITLVINWTKKTYQLEDWIELNDLRNIPITIDTDILFSGSSKLNNTFQFNKVSGHLKMTSYGQTLDKLFEGECKVVTPKI